ncbi:NAD-dependent epimerase/dehydratase family protein [Mycobacterium seoulense]|uniref:NAD-dependent epimerase/dehydratase family protein n=1 Tax=Mycobacterium seoulense TaxID=386911 RepID=UPI003CEF05A0
MLTITAPARHPIVEADLDQILEAPLPWERFAGRTVLVAGAAGFLGAYMVETLLRLNETRNLAPVRVLALARRAESLRERFLTHGARDDLRFIVQDACAPAPRDEPIHFVVHAASPGSPRVFGRDPLGTFGANVFATRELLELRPPDGFLFFSSGEVYGLGNDQVIPTHEDAYGFLDPTKVRSCYGEGKRAGETLCACYVAQEGVPATMARIFHTYGPGMPLADGRVFSDFVGDALGGRDLVMRSDGHVSRAFCYLSDTVEGCFTILLKGAAGTAYNVGNDRAELTVSELANLIVDLEPERGLRVRRKAASAADPYLPSPIQRGCPDVSRLRGLGWAPRIGPRAGFLRTLNSFR